ncbi:MAG TPA: GNAT family N-acetyltransferase [Acidimicrobiales bacterium]|nr:GNAT family N-acetyltransferase [Acidimicrobiales bacterium]
MEIRRATNADALAIATVHVRSWQSAYRGLLPQLYLDELDPITGAEQWREVLGATDWPTTGTLVLIDEPGTVTGFAHLGPTGDDDDDPATVGELRTLYLDPLVWRGGGGSLLLHAVEEQMGDAGFRVATAWTLENNAPARAFYERNGWRPDGATKFHDWGAFLATDVRYRFDLP